jgi:hypothetical protein
MGRLAAFATALVVAMGLAAPAWAAGGFSDWAVVVIAGDDEAAHDNTPTKAFDNARRDVAQALVRRGFAPDHIAQFSLHPEAYPEDHAGRTSLQTVWSGLGAMAARTQGGCLVYLTSHGSPDGVVMADHILPPALLAAMVGRVCKARPTAVILSACFSGVNLPALEGPNRFVFTAARRDRSSFGCSENDRYPFFDGCVIQTLPQATDFIDLSDRVKRCVSAREDAEGMRPRSLPQVFVGPAFRQAAPAFGGG